MKHIRLSIALLSACLTAQGDPAAGPGDSRAAIAAVPISAPFEGGLPVHVVDGETGAPVAGADVFVVPNPRTDAERAKRQAFEKSMHDPYLPRSDRLRLLAAAMGTRYRTGADGAVFVTKEIEQGSVLVFAGDKMGLGRLTDTAPVKLQTLRRLAVQVTTRGGQPARGVPIGIDRQTRLPLLSPVAITDAAGHADIEVPIHYDDKLRVGLLAALPEMVTTDVDLTQLPAAPILLQLPTCGQVRFILYGPDEKPAAALRSATLRLLPKEPRNAARTGNSASWALPSDLDTDNALFAWVALGQDVVVTAGVEDIAQDITFQGKGPTREGELVVVEGRLTVGPPILSFRVLDQRGEPVLGERLGIVLRGPRGCRYFDQKTDTEGRMQVPIEPTARFQDLYVVRRESAAATVYRGAAHRTLGDLAPGTQPIDDLRLVDEPVIARGRLVDGDGKPLAGLVVQGQTSITSGNGGGSITGHTGQMWFFQHRVSTDEGGVFELREFDPIDQAITLNVEGTQWCLPGALQIKPGNDTPQFRLYPLATIPARFAGEDLLGIDCDADLLHRESGQHLRANFHDGVLQLVRWAAGTYDITIGHGSVEFTILDVVAPAGGQVTDPRLRAIQVPDDMLFVTATVRDDRNQPVDDVPVWCIVARGDGRGGGAKWTNATGKVRFLARRTACEIEVKATGYEPVTVKEIVADMPIRLQRVAPVTVQLVGLPQRPAELSVHVSVSADPKVRSLGSVLQGNEITLHPEKLGTCHLALLPRAQWSNELPLDVRRQIDRLLGDFELLFEFEATAEPGDPKQFTLTKEQQDDLAERLDAVKAFLAERDK